MVKRDVLVMKPKHEYHLSLRGECAYDAYSWKERRLFCESMFILIEKQTLILKRIEREVFLIKPKHQHLLSQWGEYVYIT